MLEYGNVASAVVSCGRLTETTQSSETVSLGGVQFITKSLDSCSEYGMVLGQQPQ